MSGLAWTRCRALTAGCDSHAACDRKGRTPVERSGCGVGVAPAHTVADDKKKPLAVGVHSHSGFAEAHSPVPFAGGRLRREPSNLLPS